MAESGITPVIPALGYPCVYISLARVDGVRRGDNSVLFDKSFFEVRGGGDGLWLRLFRGYAPGVGTGICVWDQTIHAAFSDCRNRGVVEVYYKRSGDANGAVWVDMG